MASTGGVTMDGDLMRHAEYSVKEKMKSDADIDRRLVGFGYRHSDFSGVCSQWKYCFNPGVRLRKVKTKRIGVNINK